MHGKFHLYFVRIFKKKNGIFPNYFNKMGIEKTVIQLYYLDINVITLDDLKNHLLRGYEMILQVISGDNIDI